MDIKWVKYRQNLRGRDPLGVQAIGIHLYGLLMPGITNVTDRLRYYSFYPWILKVYKDQNPKITFLDFLRRSEFLFGFIAYCHHVAEEGWSGHMVGTMVMKQAFTDLQASGTFKLSKYTELEDSEQRYFKNRLGGFGQYYLGSVTKLAILYRKDEYEFHLYPRGNDLANAFQGENLRDLFVSCVLKDKVINKDIEELETVFCACTIPRNSREYKLLASYLYDADDISYQDLTYRRRNTLALLFSLLKQIGKPADYWFLLNALYYGADTSGKNIIVPSACEEIAQSWKYYVRHEYLSIGLLAMFASIQQVFDGRSLTGNQVTDTSWETLLVKFRNNKMPNYFLDCHKQLLKNPPLEACIMWLKQTLKPRSALHENMLSEFNIERRIINKSYPADEIFLGGILLVLFTLLRLKENDNVQPVNIDLSVFYKQYPINLVRLKDDYFQRWRTLRISEVVSAIISDYILNRHLDVAIGKLYAEGLATFRILREDGKYAHSEMEFDSVDKTSPRLTESLQMLADLKIVKESRDGFLIADEAIGNEYFKDILHGT